MNALAVVLLVGAASALPKPDAEPQYGAPPIAPSYDAPAPAPATGYGTPACEPETHYITGEQ